VLALIAALAPLIAYEPLIHGANRYAGKFWTTFGWDSALTFFAWLVRSPAVPPQAGTWALVAVFAVVAVVALALARLGGGDTTGERAAAIGFLALPLVAVTLAKVKTGAFTERYALAAVLGLAVLVPLGLHQVRRGRGVLQAIAIAGLAAFFLRACVYDVRDVNADLVIQRETIAFLERSDPRLPIVVAHPHDYLELQRYAAPALRSRLRYLVSRRLALHYLGTSSTDDGLVVIGRFTRFELRPYDSFLRSRDPFLVLVNPGAGPRFWLLKALAADHRTLRRVAEDDGRLLYAVR
jgi:hypothetical protein